MRAAAIIAAAGIGRRMGGDCPKQYLELSGRPIICHTLDRFLESDIIDEMVIVVEPGREAAFSDEILKGYGYPGSWKVARGGKQRQESVYCGLKELGPECDVVLVHDGVRPFVMPDQIRTLADIAFKEGACILAHPIKETVKRVNSDGRIMETVDRSSLWGAQTPQAFRFSILMEAMEAAFRDGFFGTDEAVIVERLGRVVRAVKGDDRNIKITTPSDLAIAESIVKEGF